MTYGEHAQQARRRAGLTTRQLQELSGVSRNTITLIELDRCYSALNKVLKITEALGIGLNEYFGIAPSKPHWEERGEESIGAFAKYQREHVFLLSKVDLSKRSGVNDMTIYTLETEKRQAATLTVLVLAKALGLSPDEYIGNPCPAVSRGKMETED